MPDSNPPPMTPDELRRLFPIERPLIKDGVFEIGLVLGGTVSAGAYTGGVIDYLIEALDAWARAKEQRPAEVPRHEAVISTIGGTSGGGINGAILLRAAGFEFEHGSAAENPFHSAWTAGVDLTALLSTAKQPGVDDLASLLNCATLDVNANAVIAWTGRPLGSMTSPARRSYLADPLRLFAMVGNVTGIPYSIELKGGSGLAHELMAHADFVRFALAVPGGVPDGVQSRPDEIALATASATSWDILRDAALATSAFPMALRGRPLERALAGFGYRVAVVPQEEGPSDVVQLLPKWSLLHAAEQAPGRVPFANVDGGTMNNEPVDVVRMALAGQGGRNKRAGEDADRAVVLIDPFSDPEELGPTAVPSAPALLLPFINSLIYQNRMKPVDVALARSPDTFSRFLLAPLGPDPADPGKTAIGRKVIASGGLGGFLGFVDRGFLEYDYRLGRANAYQFLSKEFMLPEGNALFSAANNWTDAMKAQYADVEGGTRYLPIVPLMPELKANPPPVPAPWPRLAQFPPTLADAIEARLDFLYKALAGGLPGSWVSRTLASGYLWLGWRLAARAAIRDAAVNAIRQALVDQRLL